MNDLHELNPDAGTATDAVLAELSYGKPLSAKQIFERSELLESRQEVNKILWSLRTRGLVKSSPAPVDSLDPGAKLVWSIIDSARFDIKNETNQENEETDQPHFIEIKPNISVRAQKPSGERNNVKENISEPSGAKYRREILGGVDGMIDVYSVLLTFGVTCQARGHAIKKLLCPGIRGTKNELQDLIEARDAITRAIELL